MVAGSGQYAFDPLGDYASGVDTRNKLNDITRADQARGLAGEALTGNTNALRSLAGVDPSTYMDVSKFQSGQQADQATAEAAKQEQVLGALYAADTPEKWARTIQYLKQTGHEVDPEEEDFANREAILASAQTMMQQQTQANSDRSYALEQQKFAQSQQPKPEGPFTLGPGDIRYDAQGNKIVEGNAAQGGGKPPIGYRYTPDGNLEPIKGGPADPNKPVPARAFRPTTDQTNAAGFYDRMADAERTLSDPAVVNAAIDYIGKTKANLPFGAGNYFASPEYQKFDQAQRNFINAVLRKESGAAISQGEFDNAAVQYFPQPGDTPDKIALKAQNRATAIHSMKRAASSVLSQDQDQQGAQATAPPAAPITEADLPQAMQEAQDAIAAGADPQAVVDELINSGVDPDFAGNLLNGQ